MSRRQTILAACLLVLLAGSSFWGYAAMAAGRRRALHSSAQLAECRRLADRIDTLQNVPDRDAEPAQLVRKTTRRIEAAAKAAGIPADRLVGITPGPMQRLGDTVYKEKPTQVLLRQVTLRKLVGMIHSLLDAEQHLSPQSIRLSAASADDCGDLWNAEVVLTYLIYDPPSNPR